MAIIISGLMIYRGGRNVRMSLVSCEHPQHVGKIMRFITKYHADIGEGSTFCRSCAFKGNRNPHFGKKHSVENNEKMREINLGRVLSKEIREKISKAMTGTNNPFYGKNHSLESKKKNSDSHIGKFIGEKNPRWNPNLTEEDRERERHLTQLIPWRKSVFQRDCHTCQVCNIWGGEIRAHHLNGWNWAKNERFDINNGITLCECCHTLFHSIYGYGDNTKAQFLQFKSTILNGF